MFFSLQRKLEMSLDNVAKEHQVVDPALLLPAPSVKETVRVFLRVKPLTGKDDIISDRYVLFKLTFIILSWLPIDEAMLRSQRSGI